MIGLKVEEGLLIKTTPERIFALYSDIDNWASWNPAVPQKMAPPEGERRTLELTTDPSAAIQITRLIPNQAFTVETEILMCIISQEYELFASPLGTYTTHRVVFTGWLSPLYFLLLNMKMRKMLKESLQGLKRAAEY
ncbi:MAG: SRPBCC family protein [Elusimicrobiales bacterium]|nr:SRPBCC family protein [Elusimicrobiales bacterium]